MTEKQRRSPWLCSDPNMLADNIKVCYRKILLQIKKNNNKQITKIKQTNKQKKNPGTQFCSVPTVLTSTETQLK